VRFQIFMLASYIFAFAFLTESYVRCLGLDSKQDGVEYESYDADSVTSSLAFKGYIVGFCAWMLPMPLVHIPVSLLLSRLYQSKELFGSFDAPPVPWNGGPAWFADPDNAELRGLLEAYFDSWGPEGTAGRFRNATPQHFTMFVLHRMRAKGHGSLSYVASRRVEAVFEARVEELIAEDKMG